MSACSVCVNTTAAPDRIRRIERHVSRAALHDRQQAHDHVEASIHQDRDPPARPHPTSAERGGDFLRTGVKLSVRETFVTRLNRGAVRIPTHPLLEERGEGRVARIFHRRLVPGLDQHRTLVGAEHHQLRESRIGPAGHLLEQGDIVRADLLGRRGVEQLPVVVERDASGLTQIHRYRQIELRTLVVQQFRGVREAIQAPPADRSIGDVEQDLDEGRTAQVTLGVEFGHELLERQVLVPVRVESHLTNSIQ
jgi:hypothetical protein